MDVILLAFVLEEHLFFKEGVMKKRYKVTLTREERSELEEIVSTGKSAARKITRARLLLLADESAEGPAMADPEIVNALGCGRATVERVRKQFVEEGLEETLERKPTLRTFANRIDGEVEARLIAMACGSPPEGRARWTLRLLAENLVALGYLESVSHETVRRTLKKTNLNLG